MKKLFAILLLLTFWFSAVGFYHIFKLMQAEVRHSIKVKLENDVPEKELTIIIFSPGEKINWIRPGKEFRHEGRMYDVVRKYEKDGKLVFYCIDDRQESLLIAKMEKLLKDNVKNDKSTSVNSFRSLLNLFPNLYFQETPRILNNLASCCLLQDTYHQNTLTGHLPEFTPPPVIG